jgi:hypothetical protein
MDPFISIEKTLTGIAKNIFDVMKEGANLSMNPDAMGDADIAKFWRDLQNVGETSNKSAVDEAHSQVKDAVTKHMVDNGIMSAEQADQWFWLYWTPVMQGVNQAEQNRINAEQNRKYHSTGAKLKRSILPAAKVAGWLAFAGIMLTLIFSPSVPTAPSLQDQEWNAAQSNANITSRALEQMTVTTHELTSMLSNLGPAPTPSEPPTPLAAVPAGIQATEAEPLTVEVTTPTGNRQITTTVRQFYQAAPPSVRQEMEAPKIDHGYNHEDPNDCAHRHCLTPHKDFTISADFDSGGVQRVHVHY